MPGFLDDLLYSEATIPAGYQSTTVLPSEGVWEVDPFFPPEIYTGGGIWQPAPADEGGFWDNLEKWIGRGVDIYGDIAGGMNPQTQPSGGYWSGQTGTVLGMPTNTLLLAGGAVLAVYLLTKKR